MFKRISIICILSTSVLAVSLVGGCTFRADNIEIEGPLCEEVACMSHMNETLRQSVMRRDLWVCRCTGCTKKITSKNPLSVHHIDHDHGNNDEDNLISLCMSCNREIEAQYIRGLARARHHIDWLIKYGEKQNELFASE